MQSTNTKSHNRNLEDLYKQLNDLSLSFGAISSSQTMGDVMLLCSLDYTATASFALCFPFSGGQHTIIVVNSSIFYNDDKLWPWCRLNCSHCFYIGTIWCTCMHFSTPSAAYSVYILILSIKNYAHYST